MDWKQIGRKLLFPPGWLIAVLTPLSAGLLTLIFVKGWEQSVIAYAVYVLSFYALSVVCIFSVCVIKKNRGRLKNSLLFAGWHSVDDADRIKVSLYISLLVSLLYVLVNLLSWVLNRSWWFVVLAAYYVILSVMRLLLVSYVRRNKIGSCVQREWKRARVCAYILLLVNFCLSGAVLMMVYQDKGYEYPGVMIYVMAMYTFYSTIHAVIDLIKYRKRGSPVLSAKQIVNLSAALVSMLNLETAMFAQFGGEMSLQNQRLMIMLTGGGVSLAVIGLSGLLVMKATLEIRREQYGET